MITKKNYAELTHFSQGDQFLRYKPAKKIDESTAENKS